MKSLYLLLASLRLALALSSSSKIPVSVLRGHTPIYLGDVFYPPSLTLLAWIPSQNNSLSEWCTRMVEISISTPFSLSGFTDLEVHDYFSSQAYITWNGNRFMDCYISPESTKLDGCERITELVEAKGAGAVSKLMGPAGRKWACWVVGAGEGARAVDASKADGFEGDVRLTGSEAVLTEEMEKPTGRAGVRGGKASSGNSILGAFTAAVTAHGEL